MKISTIALLLLLDHAAARRGEMKSFPSRRLKKDVVDKEQKGKKTSIPTTKGSKLKKTSDKPMATKSKSSWAPTPAPIHYTSIYTTSSLHPVLPAIPTAAPTLLPVKPPTHPPLPSSHPTCLECDDIIH